MGVCLSGVKTCFIQVMMFKVKNCLCFSVSSGVRGWDRRGGAGLPGFGERLPAERRAGVRRL